MIRHSIKYKTHRQVYVTVANAKSFCIDLCHVCFTLISVISVLHWQTSFPLCIDKRHFYFAVTVIISYYIFASFQQNWENIHIATVKCQFKEPVDWYIISKWCTVYKPVGEYFKCSWVTIYARLPITRGYTPYPIMYSLSLQNILGNNTLLN